MSEQVPTGSETVTIPLGLVVAVVRYLAARPYAEVHELIAVFQESVREAQAAEEAKPDDG